MYYLGLDTSCYTTSAALIDFEENLIYDCRTVLKVDNGSRGIRQSDAFYQHIGNMECIIERIFKEIDKSQIKAIGISSRPRNIEGSYMPVFNAGLNIGHIISHSLEVPVFTLSHQVGHVLAGLWSCGLNISDSLLVYHLSGGTTELIYVEGRKDMDIKKIGGSSDLKAGQFIDRIGVAMGYKFPCGWELDMLSKEAEGEKIDIPIAIKGTYASFSGPETFVQRLISKKEYRPEDIAQSVFTCISKSIEQTLLNVELNNESKYVLFVGGVAANSIIRKNMEISKNIRGKKLIPVFADEKFSTDTGIGPAIWAKLHIQS